MGHKKPAAAHDRVGRYDEIPPLPLIPVEESSAVIIGKLVNANAYLSNDKKGVYTEFTINGVEILKSDPSDKVTLEKTVIADRAGGFVQYPNGHKVLYLNSNHDLPRAGGEYLLFLVRKEKNENYELLVVYELKDHEITPLDEGHSFDEFKNYSKNEFINIVRNEISRHQREKNHR